MSDLEEGIAKIWRDVLRVEHVGPHDNFFDLGGDSILVTKAILRMKKKLGIDVNIGDFFEYPIIRKISNSLIDNQNNIIRENLPDKDIQNILNVFINEKD
jgi:iturin family lipopeptide synthetase A/iturin family lipopeptide synthetase C/tyrocidine synthetase-3